MKTKASADPGVKPDPQTDGAVIFVNEPLVDFAQAERIDELRAALATWRGRLGEDHPLVIDNKPVRTRSWLMSPNPANQEEIVGLSAKATIADADAALEAARAAQPTWARTPALERAALLRKVAELMRRDKVTLTALIILEAGKPITEADGDVAEAIDFCEFYAAEAPALETLRTTLNAPGEINQQHWLPRGTGVVIAPWNFPLAILAGMTAASIAVGNAVIMKPAKQTSVIGACLMGLFVAAGMPPGVVNYLPGLGEEVGAHLVAHPQIDFIAFTGSRDIGLHIWEAAGRTVPGQRNLKKVVCEMGGKNALIVDSDADLDEAVKGVIKSAFSYSGQKCSALSRLIVLEECYDRFLALLLDATPALRVGPAEDVGVVVCPLIDAEAQQRVLKMIELSKKDATLAWQGSAPDDPNTCYVPPSIFTDVPTTSRLWREEVFGPVLAVVKAKDFDEALMLANDSDYALTGGLFSHTPEHIERAKAELACGNLYINRAITGAMVARQPFGGFRMSGGGTKAGGVEYLHQFLVPRIVTEKLTASTSPPTT